MSPKTSDVISTVDHEIVPALPPVGADGTDADQLDVDEVDVAGEVADDAFLGGVCAAGVASA